MQPEDSNKTAVAVNEQNLKANKATDDSLPHFHAPHSLPSTNNSTKTQIIYLI